MDAGILGLISCGYGLPAYEGFSEEGECAAGTPRIRPIRRETSLMTTRFVRPTSGLSCDAGELPGGRAPGLEDRCKSPADSSFFASTRDLGRAVSFY